MYIAGWSKNWYIYRVVQAGSRAAFAGPFTSWTDAVNFFERL